MTVEDRFKVTKRDYYIHLDHKDEKKVNKHISLRVLMTDEEICEFMNYLDRVVLNYKVIEYQLT